ncbi:hypothetical protein M2164_006195 [Streptomyces sp. SAI-208]|uniref:hypothetical protein n=1 Tax=unclassified Streptomyces TaxID=2593676 RepID=UPI002476E4A7|nr:MULTISPECIES: hypothetical protein [unclassified Streptomyces]MDH6551794.1 hypothetical protein [Streptomyces sp. SAI-041]MDH6570883.1 hypothetical protein [Streptomyces sp. SAI-117]MDH6584149.1 hypothetical protein [Streptomyces sp. SAI-133]MDH6610560.1 hypothetical protein [Streptomyces sp. SAI-208]
MHIGGRRGLAVTAVIGAIVGVAGCGQPSARATAETAPSSSRAITAMAGTAPGRGAACVFVKPDGAQKFGHVGWGFKVPGTGRWVYGAVENPSGRLYTPPGGDIGAWHAEGSYERMLSEMSTDAHYPGTSEHPYSRYRCTKSPTYDVNRARDMIRTVEARGFLVGVDPRTGKLTSRDCLDATYDVLKAYRTRHLTPAPRLSVPNVWVEELWGWSDRQLTPR